jgi:DNA-binding NarL/FixJ family response regulator
MPELSTVFYDAAQNDIGVSEVHFDTLLIVDSEHVRLCKALLLALKWGRRAAVETFLKDEIKESARPDHLRRQADRKANAVVEGIRAGRTNTEIAAELGIDPAWVAGYREAQ